MILTAALATAHLMQNEEDYARIREPLARADGGALELLALGLVAIEIRQAKCLDVEGNGATLCA